MLLTPLLGVFINGSAGNLALKKMGLHLVATDLISNIPDAMKPLICQEMILETSRR
jgi:NAD(P)H-hydrate repair Nnr-like enzyme with NAD(P)H-hydrate dehydratase domain